MNILIITYFSYKDGLTQAYTLPYIRQIRSVIPKESKLHFTTLEQKHLRLTQEEKSAIEKELCSENISISFFQWRGSGIVAAMSWSINLLILIKKILFEKYEIIHAWNTPSGIFGYILSMITGRKLVIDSYEPHAEPMVEAGQWRRDSLRFRILFSFEKLMSHRASLVIACVEKMQEYASKKYHAAFPNFLWKPACVDFEKFDYRKYSKEKERERLNLKKGDIICVYAGKFGGSYLTKEVFEFFAQCRIKWASSFKVILLGNHNSDFLNMMCKEVGIEESIVQSYLVKHEDVPRFLSVGDFGLTPFVPVPSKRYGSPIKTGEYMAMGLPQIISKNISDDSELISENSSLGCVLEKWDLDNFKIALESIEDLITKPQSLRSDIRSIARQKKHFNLSRNKYQEYVTIMDQIVNPSV